MTKADQFSFPCQFTGSYPNGFAGYTFLQKTEQDAYHPGIDWNWGAGEQDNAMPVQAIANGTCIHTSEQAAIGYGEIVVLKHELTDEMYEFIKKSYNIDTHIIYSLYAHLKDSNVKLNQEVKRGELIGWIGKSGTTVSHLHQELYKSVPGTSWRYWPKLSAGWTLDKLKQYYIDTFELIENQPSVSPPTDTTQKDLDTCRVDRDGNHNDRIALFEELGFTGVFNRTVAVEKIRQLRALEKQFVEKDEQLKVANSKVTELEVRAKEAEEKLTEFASESTKTIQTLTSENQSLSRDITELKNAITAPVRKGWKATLVALIDRL